MPNYDYRCRVCSHAFIVRQGYHDAREAQCPLCGGEAIQRISMPAVVFKGSGFYVNDYGGRRTGSPSRDLDDDGSSNGSQESAGDADSHGADDGCRTYSSPPASTSGLTGHMEPFGPSAAQLE